MVAAFHIGIEATQRVAVAAVPPLLMFARCAARLRHAASVLRGAAAVATGAGILERLDLDATAIWRSDEAAAVTAPLIAAVL